MTTRRKRSDGGIGHRSKSSCRARTCGRPCRFRYRAADATLRHLEHRPPQDRDHRLDRRPDRDRRHRGLGRRRLQRRIQAPRLGLQGSLRPARNEVPGAVRRHRADRLQGRRRRRIAGGQEEDGGGLRRSRKVPPRQRSRQPLRRAAPAAISDDGKIAYATIQFDVHEQQARQRKDAGNHRDRPGRRRATASRSSSAASRSQEAEQEEGDSSFGIGLLAAIDHPAAHLRLGRRDGPADHHRAVRARRRHQPGHARHPRLRHRQLRAGPGGDDRARRRHRLRALHPHPLPQRASTKGSSRARRRSPPSTPPAAPSSSPGSP